MKDNLKAFFRGFVYAAKGLWHCIRCERNFRFHMAAGAYVLYFSRFFAFEKSEYVALMLTIALVLALEAVNSAIEQAVDFMCPQPNPLAGRVKDIAAGAVLVCAIFAFIIGVVLFFNPAVWGRIAQYFVSRPVSLVLLAASIVVSVLFVFGPKNKKKTNKE